MRLRCLLLLSVASPTCGLAQAVVIPGAHADRDAPGLGDIAGFAQPFRQQIVLRADELAPLRGRELVSLWLRRDTQLAMPLRPGKADLVVLLSAGGPHPSNASAVFAANHGAAPVEVFRGTVDLPAAPMPSGPGSAGWKSPTAVEIKFTTPFRYTQGPLCVELQGRPTKGQQTPAWPVDHDTWVADGTSAMLGRTSDPRLQAMAVWENLVPGTRVTMHASGPAQATAVCMIGSQRQVPLDLAPAGAPNCAVLVEPWLLLSFRFPRVKADAVTRLEHQVQLAPEPCLLGASFAIQWAASPVDGNQAKLATTHAQVLRLANCMPAFPGAVIRTGVAPGPTFPDEGQVVRNQMPVLRLVGR